MGVIMEIYDERSRTASATIKAINIVLIVIIVILALILVSMSFLWTPMTVNGPSMNNTLHDGERFILQTCWYSYTYGDIIVFGKINEEKNVIKRVIGLPGDYIRFSQEEGAWYRNGEKLVEEYVSSGYPEYYMSASYPQIKAALCSETGYLIEEDKVFVLGDNRENSNDSHVYGSIGKSQIKGKFIFGYN